jgi:hypothetical protein
MATYSSKKYPSGSVTSATLADGSVVAVDLADGAVTSAKLNSTVDLSGKTVTYRSIVAGDIASNAITSAKMANSGAELGMRNRIINGAMVIDQRNAGASVTMTNAGGFQYSLDRWCMYISQSSKCTIQQNAGSVTPPVGFINYLGLTSSSAYTVGSAELFDVVQFIEGYNVADLGWGTANAKTVTLSFQVRSSLTGTFGGALLNSAQDRSYPFNYTISAANTWTPVSITITGDTSGTWLTTNGKGIFLSFGVGVGSTLSGTAGAWAGASYFSATGAVSVVGTNGATFYITGVQLEVGSTATPFENRSFGTELFLCMRYYQSVCATSADTAGSASGIPMRVTAVNNGGTQPLTGWQYPVAMRASPSIQTYGGGVAGGSFITNDSGGGSATQTSFSGTDIGSKGCRVNLTGRSNSAYQYWIDCGIAGTQLGWTQNAEL